MINKSPAKKQRDARRHQFWKLRKLERQRMLRESFWDRRIAELVSLGVYPMHNVDRGEVLFDNRGYVSPALSGYR